MGWFNKKYIHDEKIFDERLMMIYQKSYNNRQDADYEITNGSDLSKKEVELALNDTELFNDEIRKYCENFI